MSCDISWDSMETGQFKQWTKDLLYDALNSGKRPHILSSEIQIKDLEFGSNAPIIEILEIGDLANDKFRGIFKLKYDGDAQITLRTSIQANLLNIYESNSKELDGGFATPKFPFSSQPFSIPLFVSLSNIRLSGIIIVVFSKVKGLTLVFKNDPLENIKVSSSFDNVQVIEKFLQNKIEHQIRDLFRDILPSVLHKVSQRWTTSNLINEVHSKLNNNNNNVERLSIFEINPSEPEISPANMLKLSTLNTSRQSFRLSVLPFPDVIERSTINKYEHSNSIGNIKSSKTIPIEILTKNKGSKLDETLIQITKIQSKIYTNENSKTKLKKRCIKLGKQKHNQQEQEDVEESDSSDSTLIEVIESKEFPPQLILKKPESKQVKTESDNMIKLKPANFLKQPLSHKLSIPYSPLSPLKSTDYFHRANSPRRSQSNLLSVGLGNTWMDAPPPYY